jgi:hypothetical protein
MKTTFFYSAILLIVCGPMPDGAATEEINPKYTLHSANSSRGNR